MKLRFKGRQKAHKEFGFEVVNKFVRDVAAYGQADSPPKMLGDRDLNVVITPLHRDKRGKNPRLAAPLPSAPPADDNSPTRLRVKARVWHPTSACDRGRLRVHSASA